MTQLNLFDDPRFRPGRETAGSQQKAGRAEPPPLCKRTLPMFAGLRELHARRRALMSELRVETEARRAAAKADLEPSDAPTDGD